MDAFQTADNKSDTQSLLDAGKQPTRSCKTNKRWSTMQCLLFSITIAVLAVLLSNIDRIIDVLSDVVSDSDDSVETAETLCYLGVYDGPDISIPDDYQWGYEGVNRPAMWSKYYPQCGCNTWQSPINIDPNYVSVSTPQQLCSASNNLLSWEIHANYTQKYNGTFEVIQNGHTIALRSVNYENNDVDPVATLKNAWRPANSSLHSEFVFDHIHFHWGKVNEYGSGHTLLGKVYPLEAHFVHYSADYDTLWDALDDWKNLHKSGKDRHVLAVVGVLFSINESDASGANGGNINNPLFHQMLKLKVNSSNEHVGLLQNVDLMHLLPHNINDIGSYYYYSGSLTTPPCMPIVRWHVVSTPLYVNITQLTELRNLADNIEPRNWRPVQNNNNAVYGCYANFVE
eukprot:331898_1